MYAPSAERYFSRSPGYEARMMFCHARPRKSSFATWQASASPSGAHSTWLRWWMKTATAWKKAPILAPYGRSGSGGDQDPVRGEPEQQPEQERPRDERRHREPPAHLEE